MCVRVDAKEDLGPAAVHHAFQFPSFMNPLCSDFQDYHVTGNWRTNIPKQPRYVSKHPARRGMHILYRKLLCLTTFGDRELVIERALALRRSDISFVLGGKQTAGLSGA